MECHPPAATHFILTPVRSSTRQGCSLVSRWPKPSWPRLKIIKNIISKKYLKRRKLLLKCVLWFYIHPFQYWNFTFTGIYLRERTCVFILSKQICKQILKLLIKAMHTSNNVMNLMCRLRFIRGTLYYHISKLYVKGENSYWKTSL